jgi:hypothetical protein
LCLSGFQEASEADQERRRIRAASNARKREDGSLAKHADKGDIKLKLTMSVKGYTSIVVDPNLGNILQLGSSAKDPLCLPAVIVRQVNELKSKWEEVAKSIHQFRNQSASKDCGGKRLCSITVAGSDASCICKHGSTGGR